MHIDTEFFRERIIPKLPVSVLEMCQPMTRFELKLRSYFNLDDADYLIYGEVEDFVRIAAEAYKVCDYDLQYVETYYVAVTYHA